MKKSIKITFLIFSIFTLKLLGQNYHNTDNMFARIYLQPFTAIYVDDDNTAGTWNGTPEHPFQYIRDGLAAANSEGTVIVKEGTYHITQNITIPDIITLNMEPNVINLFDDGVGVNVYGKLQALGTVADSVIFTHKEASGNSWNGIRFINSNAGSELRFCKIEYANGLDGDQGGAIYCSNSSPKISHCLIQNNSANYGAALFCESGASPEISDCLITNNSAALAGGGIFSHFAAPVIRDNFIINNQSNGTIGGGGLVVYDGEVGANVLSVQSLRKTNVGVNETMPTNKKMDQQKQSKPLSERLRGGLISLKNQTESEIKEQPIESEQIFRDQHGVIPVIEGNTFADNTSSSDGGALVVHNRKTIIYDNTFENNTASQGGAIHIAEADSGLIDWNIFEENEASGNGGAMYANASIGQHISRNLILHNRASNGAGFCLNSSGLKISNNTLFSNNAGSQGSGIYSINGNNQSVNNILWDTDASNASQVAGTGISVAYSDVEGGFSGEGNIALEPQFVDTTRIGFGLQFNSPCINAGDPASPSDPDSSRADMGLYPFFRVMSVIEVLRESIVLTSERGIITEKITITNTGENELHWNITSSVGWIKVTVPTGSIKPTESRDVDVNINSTELIPDSTYSANLSIVSNVYDYSTIVIPVELTVIHGILNDPFTRITTGAIVSDGGNSYNGCWGDYDNDDNIDLFVTNASGNNFLYHNNGNGTFEKITTGDIVNDGGQSNGCCWGDFNNDGFLDLYVTNYKETNFLYVNNGDLTFSKLTTSGTTSLSTWHSGCSWIDYNNDGYLDLFVSVSGGGDNVLYRNNGDNTFSVVTHLGISRRGNWADFDSDGDADLFAAWYPHNSMYRNNGDDTFTNLTEEPVVTDISNSTDGNWGDYDNDGDLDLFVTNVGYNYFYTNNGNGTFTNDSGGETMNILGSYGPGVCGDFDNDGDLDIYISNRSGNNFLLYNNSDGTFERYVQSELINNIKTPIGVSCADVDRDGDLDIFICSGGGNNYLFSNKGNSNHWINIKCLGTVSHTSGVGAKVRIKANVYGTNVWQLRDISSQMEYSGQNSLNAQFGLGDAAVIDSIKIEWPSGSVQVLTNVLADQFVTVTENQANLSPQVVDIIPDVTLNAKGETFSRDINGPPALFSDPDGDDLRYRASSSDDSVAIVNVSETMMIVSAVSAGTSTIRITATDGKGGSASSTFEVTVDIATNVASETVNIPKDFVLEQNYPNPFNPTTTISYAIPQSHANKNVKLEIYNTIGQKIRILVNKNQTPGYYSVQWDAKDVSGVQVSSGLYLYKLSASQFVEIKKMVCFK